MRGRFGDRRCMRRFQCLGDDGGARAHGRRCAHRAAARPCPASAAKTLGFLGGFRSVPDQQWGESVSHLLLEGRSHAQGLYAVEMMRNEVYCVSIGTCPRRSTSRSDSDLLTQSDGCFGVLRTRAWRGSRRTEILSRDERPDLDRDNAESRLVCGLPVGRPGATRAGGGE
jgi:hypothetical protein